MKLNENPNTFKSIPFLGNTARHAVRSASRVNRSCFYKYENYSKKINIRYVLFENNSCFNIDLHVNSLLIAGKC